jgi:hypothetical protein
MASWFLNPIFFWVGVGAISAPIIIHLINRMRYRRIRWAAMEFLLKSQKRNRRRLIIEQLILLGLRCLLVVLAGLLVARFVGAIWEPNRSTSHMVILDDTVSMTDHWRDQGLDRTAFDSAKQMIKDIARRAGQTRSAQQFQLIRLTDCKGPETLPVLKKALNDELVAELNNYLDDKATKNGPTALHASPLVGLRTAADLFANDPYQKKVLYFVSDFRHRDWSGPDADSLAKVLDDLVHLNVHVKMVDVANPARGETRQVLVNHDNLAVTELRPESRVAPIDIPLQFTVTVNNYSNNEKKNVRVTIKVNGVERPEGSLTILPGLPPGPVSQTFQIGFNQEGYHQVTANIEAEETGLLADNVRYAVIEVRKQVPILVIDGDGLSGGKRPGGTYFLQNLFGAAKGYQLVSKNIDELSKPSLNEYPSIILLNVKATTIGDKGLRNLEKYIQDGGGVAFFMGPRIDPGEYNRLLWRDGAGLFPVPLDARPTDAKGDPGERIMRALSQQPSIYIRDEQHPMFAELYKEDKEKQINKFFPYIGFDKYYAVQRGRWNRTPQQDELITLPNRQPLDTYKGEAQALIEEMKKRGQDDKNKVYRPALERYYTTIRNGLGAQYDHLFQLATDLDRLLREAGDKNKPDQPNLVEFFAQSDQNDLRRRLERLRESTQFGDPLMISNKFGKGRVAVVLTAVGLAAGSGPNEEPWNDWPGGPGAPTFVVLMQALQKYLTSVGDEGSQIAGAELKFQLDPVRYEPRFRRFFQERAPEPPQKDDDQLPELDLAKRQGLQDLGEQQPDPSSTKDQTIFTFNEGKRPGTYVFHTYPRSEGGAKVKPEVHAVVYNVDTETESDLKRTERTNLERPVTERAALSGTVGLNSPENPPIEKEKKSDMSETPWFYLLIIAVLVIEQALAVHLSFHLKGGESSLPAAAARTQPTAA